MTVSVVLHIIAIVLFVVAAVAEGQVGRVNLTALGLAFFAAGHVL